MNTWDYSQLLVVGGFKETEECTYKRVSLVVFKKAGRMKAENAQIQELKGVLIQRGTLGGEECKTHIGNTN